MLGVINLNTLGTINQAMRAFLQLARVVCCDLAVLRFLPVSPLCLEAPALSAPFVAALPLEIEGQELLRRP